MLTLRVFCFLFLFGWFVCFLLNKCILKKLHGMSGLKLSERMRVLIVKCRRKMGAKIVLNREVSLTAYRNGLRFSQAFAKSLFYYRKIFLERYKTGNIKQTY